MEASKIKSILLKVVGLGMVLLLSGCDSALLNPKGTVGVQEKELIITALFLMLIVVIPVILMTIWFSYKYRARKGSDEEYAPEWSHSTKVEVVVWTVPLIIILILGTITWRSTHALSPSKPLVSDVKPMTIEVVSLDWQWLFIYPKQHIATVNYLAFPKDTPVLFKITSDNIMNSFFIPRLGSQIYAMPGMVTKLNLIANEAGNYRGIGASYSGKGFSDMKFTAHALPDQASFDKWVKQVQASPKTLSDFNAYRELAKPTVNGPVTYFSNVPPYLFSDIVTQFPGAMNMSASDKACKNTTEG
ncbi:ubiquinol oxidase subunit II [Vibrio sp. S4M6]|uniref:ubiquinol oxidase subunit II n=1 Tax=Vibrio sinus TaxID=2946865 RepID=UPI00202A5C36|nr:ubiquinol oxidase subunit II [Vibrio sinus]MCL9782441.1 ubiquinol oxidase subunit II [Vibrio sinus]